MQLEEPTRTKGEEQAATQTAWHGTVPSALDVRVLGLVGVIAALAASLNIPFGGLAMAAGAFVVIAGGGVAVHVLGERKLRRITDGLVERWSMLAGRSRT